ncbi:hypothetical protein [Fonticella tunisiensis]|uniref:Uncharacterized protein n=1 Tax=Fonticella tunisiensis TaxID=1096341 RepID=A0A4R7K8R0_9CLOT|nr:hypothetical protein [Fonticella tunisiensis]TDT50388.1 hypothetical protein EDD71_1293 [Fonticella tunisiensis]
MKRWILIITIFIIIFCSSFSSLNIPFKIFVEDKEIKVPDGYIMKDGKLYISEDALRRDFGFNIFYDRPENRFRIYDITKMMYNARCQLFEDFARIYTPNSPDEAAELWARGIKERNGVFQYLALSESLRNEFKNLAEQTGSITWITGFSSPWVDSYKIVKEKTDESTYVYKIIFTAITSASDKFTWHAVITVGKENSKWRIIKIDKDFDIM